MNQVENESMKPNVNRDCVTASTKTNDFTHILNGKSNWSVQNQELFWKKHVVIEAFQLDFLFCISMRTRTCYWIPVTDEAMFETRIELSFSTMIFA